ncbi:hypothetical protein [Rhodococcus tukisamuensis]|uniref:Capsular polysaccharide biosynthesis protein n=1 Tax=Rhodococcus tukisamuensis TaxID=168276 RepID=A0A1G7ALQ4_9NOCA|nr:hypothetical protein [Rhodococcus tukisamuensis]SDE15769.1 hypothetical protein SAMN05444580_11133 [Rhodococcus tukisamuensis]
MDLFDVVKACFRRWYVVLPLLLVTAWFSYQSYSSVTPVYYSNTVIGLAQPSSRVEHVDAGVPLPRNGLLDIGGAQLITNMAALGLEQQSVVDRVVAAGGLPHYVAKMFPVPSTLPQPPLILIEVTDADPDAVSRTLGLVIAQTEITLRTLQEQARVPNDQMVAMFVVLPPTAPVAGMPSRLKSTLAIFIVGAGLSVLVTVLIDVLLTRRRSRAQQRRQPQSEAATRPDSDQLPDGVPRPIDATPAPKGSTEAT